MGVAPSRYVTLDGSGAKPVAEDLNETTDEEDAWEEFLAQDSILHGANNLRLVSRIVPWATGCVACDQMYKTGFDVGYFALNVIVIAFLFLCAEVTHKLSRKFDKSQAMLVVCIGQLLFISVGSFFLMQLALAEPTDLVLHRTYFSISIAMLFGAPYIFQMPPRVFAFVFCPLWSLGWLRFHFLAGYIEDISQFLLTVLSVYMFSSAVILVRERIAQFGFELFQTTRSLEEERKLLKATEHVLHGMLSSLWDASCTCDTHGVISTSSPHLNQLLGAAEDLVGSGLCDFAANKADAERLQKFLQNTASAGERQALRLQCALRPQGVDCQVYDAVLHGIRLPPRATVQAGRSVGGRTTLFVGIKASAPEATVGDASCSAFTDDFILTATTEDDVPRAGGLGLQLSMPTVPEDDDISVTSWAVSQRPENQTFEVNAAQADSDLSSLVSSSLAFSSSTASSGPSHAHSTVSDKVVETSVVAVQTEPLLFAEVAVQAGVQTELMQSVEVAVQAGVALPPIPRARVQQQRRATVNLRTHKVVMRGFRETPTRTMEQLLWDILFHINPRGRGCCYLHVGLAVLQQCISTMTVWQCNTNLKPLADWQCQECFGLNNVNADEFEIRDRVCFSCLSVPPLTQHVVDLNREESPSCEADVSRTDSDTLAGAE